MTGEGDKLYASLIIEYVGHKCYTCKVATSISQKFQPYEE